MTDADFKLRATALRIIYPRMQVPGWSSTWQAPRGESGRERGSGMSESSHSLSFPALLAKLRSLLPSDKHAELDAVSESINSAPSDKAAVRSSVAAAPHAFLTSLPPVVHRSSRLPTACARCSAACARSRARSSCRPRCSACSASKTAARPSCRPSSAPRQRRGWRRRRRRRRRRWRRRRRRRRRRGWRRGWRRR